jgi:hypothetical protein
MPSSARRIEPRSPDEEQHTTPAVCGVTGPPSPGQDKASDAFDTWFPVAWWAFKLLAWSSMFVVLAPMTLEYVGGHDLARWLVQHAWVRILCVPALLPFWLFSAFELRSPGRKSAARSKLADAVGGTVVGTPKLDPGLGLPEGPALRVPLGEWSMHISAWVRGSKRRTVARATVEARSSFSFSAGDAGNEPALLRGLQQGAMSLAMSQLAEKEADPARSASLATLSYLSEAPIATGHATLDRTVVLRANQPDTARSLLTSAAVQAALAAFDEPARRWSWTLFPESQPGFAEMRFECSGGSLDEARVSQIRALLAPALEHLAAAGVISRGSGR